MPADCVRDLFLGHSFLLPTPTNYLIRFSPLVLVVADAGECVAGGELMLSDFDQAASAELQAKRPEPI
jgi:hypothetical protein